MPSSHIPSFYRIFFLYIDPLICLSGLYIMFFDHPTYLASGTPSSISSLSSTALTPFTSYLLYALGSYTLFLFAMQIILLHGFKNATAPTYPKGFNVKIWRIVQGGILVVDLGLVWASWKLDPKAFLDVGKWDGGDWTNNGILGSLILLRSAFLVGIGGVGK